MFVFCLAAVIYISAVIVFAQNRAPEEYSKRRNTVSELACQFYENKSVMQSGFIGFGLFIIAGILAEASWSLKHLYYSVPLFFYAAGVLMSGIFCTRPFDHLRIYSIKESRMHSFFTQLAGFSFSVLVIIKSFMVPDISLRLMNLGTFLFILVVSLRFNASEKKKGVYQRVLYGACYIWLVFAFSETSIY